MNRIFKYFILIFLSISTLSAYAGDSDNTLKGVSLKSCDLLNKKCIEIKFQKALMSQWTPLFAFTDYELSIISNSGLSTKTIKGKKGYFDLDQNKIVVTTEEKKQKEISINLKTLEQQEFLL